VSYRNENWKHPFSPLSDGSSLTHVMVARPIVNTQYVLALTSKLLGGVSENSDPPQTYGSRESSCEA